MAEEIHALEENKTLTIEDLPPGKKLISCKWIYKAEYKSNGMIEYFKARLMVKANNRL